MSEQSNQSEVARLRAQIEAEHQACLLALHGLSSGNARHAFISKRMSNMDASYKGLEKILGEEQATDMLCEIFDAPPKRLPIDEHTSTHPGDSNMAVPHHHDQNQRVAVHQAYQGGLVSDEEMAQIVQRFAK